eukprot:PhF_6_TR43618/c0_g1_i1/m.67011/K11426/SMYD; SET and MYND domain-containing protein
MSFDVTEISGRGRGAVAKSYLVKGAMAFRGVPDIAVLYTDYVRGLCAVCFQTSPFLSLCQKCNLFAACPRCSSHKIAAQVHPIECQWICSLSPPVREGDTDYLRFILRYCALKKLGDDIVPRIDTLCTNQEIQSQEFLEWCKAFAGLFVSHFDTSLGVTFDDLVKLMCVVRANSLGFPFNEQATLGWCLQTNVSMLNHSCTPNCAITPSANKGSMEIRTLRRIRAGEELSISYVDMHDPANAHTQARNDAIFERYRFICDCVKCKSS